MSKVNFKQKQKKLREQRVRQTGWSEGTWDCSFSDSNEVLQSDEAESPKGVSQAVFDERPKAREKIKKKLEAARHKPDPSVPAEKLSDYLSSLNARDAVPPPILVRDDIPDNVQESTLSKTASRPIFEPAIKKTSKTLSIVEMAGELKKYVHIISYPETEEKQGEELVYTVENLEEASRTYSISENPYYKDSVAQYVEAINTIYGEDATQTVTETTLEQALKDSDVSRLFVEKLLKLQGEDVMTNSDFYRMDVKTDTGIVKTLFTMESERQYLEVSSQPKNRIGENEEIQFYYGGMKENKPNGNGALFSYSTEDGLSLQYVGKFKGGKIDGKGVLFAYDGLVHYLVQTGNYEKNMATGKLTTYYSNDCQSVGSFYLYKLWEYIDEKSEKWSDDEFEQQIDRLLPKKKVIKLIATVSLYESPSATVDFNQRVLIPHIGYEGEMKKGSKEGKGKLYASAGWLVYDGEWKNDKYNGKGTLYNQDGTIRKKGTFDHEALDEELIYSNLAMAAILALDKVSLDELFTVDDSDVNAATQTASAESSSTARSIPSEVLGCEKDGTWQKILVEATGSNATLTLWTYRDGQWEKDLSTTAAIGANGLTTDKTEGDHMTPEGTFPICFAFSTKEKNTMLYSKIIKEDSVWVCDPESIYYNTLQSKNNPQKDWADKGGAENMYVKFSKGSSNACICFGFNGDGESTYSATPYAGSALFIDGVGENGNMNSGYGDIKISGKDMTKLLSYLCENDNPVITIKSAQ